MISNFQKSAEQGMATLWAATLLMLLTTLMGWLSLKSIAAESRRSQQQHDAAQALQTSEALLETVIAAIDRQYAHSDASVDTRIWSQASAAHCLSALKILSQQCLLWRLNEAPLATLTLPQDLNPDASQVRITRDVIKSPNQINISVQAVLADSHAGAGSRATVQQSLYLPNAVPLSDSATAAVTLTAPAMSSSSPSATPLPCRSITWSQVFGNLRIDQYQALAAAQVQTGLNAQTVPPQTIYWIDSPLDWTQSLGSSAAPVALVFSDKACAVQCPQIADGVALEGLVYFQTPCQPSLAQLKPNAMALNFNGPTGASATRVHRVRGSWKNGNY
jgi:Tfp pilus assembly protein PilX